MAVTAWLSSGADSRQKQWLTFGLMLSVFVLVYNLVSPSWTRHHGMMSLPAVHFGSECTPNIQPKKFVKPVNVTIVGLVFFGRKSRVEILKCYIEKNLVDNGGWLDEVHWVQNTRKEEDLNYLEELLLSSPRYKKITLDAVETNSYLPIWEHLERGNLYIKMDDDVVWFADDAVSRMVTMKIQHPEYLIVSANVINSPLMGWVHYRMGAISPYLPEYGVVEPTAPHSAHEGLDPPESHTSWKYSDYPPWKGPDDWSFGLAQHPPYDGHRWLRLCNATDIHRTPITKIEYATWGTGLKSWAIAAQEHYSFLENLGRNNLDAYRFSRAWITDYERLSINFITLWADDVLDHLPMDAVDEEWLTVNLPKKLGKSVAVDSDSLAVHFSFSFQEGVGDSDLLPRYKDLATENRYS